VSTGQALVITVAATLGALACAWQAIRAWRADDRHDVGPDGLLLLEDLDAHLDAHFARVAPLFEELGPPPADPDGFDRLRAAVREQREEDGS
jgi:hypothetical protein